MHAHDAGASLRSHQRKRNAGVNAIDRLVTQNTAEERLARHAYEQRCADGEKLPKPAQQRYIVRVTLAEAEARIDDDARSVDPGSDAFSPPCLEIIPHLGDDILVDGITLHGAGLAEHMHQTHRHAELGDRPHGAGEAQRACVVDETGADIHRRPHHLGPAGVDGYGYCNRVSHRLDDGHDAVDLFLPSHRWRAGARGLPADVDDSGTFGHHALGVPQRSVAGEEAAAVGERIGGDVEYAHDSRARQIERTAAAVERGYGHRPRRCSHGGLGRVVDGRPVKTVGRLGAASRCYLPDSAARQAGPPAGSSIRGLMGALSSSPRLPGPPALESSAPDARGRGWRPSMMSLI